jgi:hypothetical protein
VSPGALERASGFHPVMKTNVMKNDNASERATALVQEAIDVLQRAGNAPDSPVNSLLPAKERRQLRRAARRLREGKSQPRYRNLHTAEELAEVYERTVRRDDMIERGVSDFMRITRDLERLLEEDAAAVDEAMETFIVEAKRSAEEQGPGSEAAARFRSLQFLGWIGQQYHTRRRRRQRARVPWRVSVAADPSIEIRNQLTAAELIDAPSEGETVIAIPPEGSGSGRERLFLRIGIGKASWIGSFERGDLSVCTISMMPDDKHLFVSAGGAGYIIDFQSRTLVGQIGTDVARVLTDESRTAFIVDHNGRSLEGFGKTGRIWKTGVISSRGFRRTAMTDTRLIGEARQPSGWTEFSVDLATGEVRFGDAAAVPKSME